MKRLTAASCTLAVLVPAAAPSTAADHPHRTHRAYCHHRLFTVAQTKRAANVIYRGTRKITRHNLRLLGQMERCQRNPRAQWFVRWYDRQAAQRHDQRIFDANHPWSSDVTASEYDDSGATASGAHYDYGFASCGDQGVDCGPWGQRVEFCLVDANDQLTGYCHEGIRQDNGPYAGGRGFDFNMNLGGYFGVGGPGQVTVRYRVIG